MKKYILKLYEELAEHGEIIYRCMGMEDWSSETIGARGKQGNESKGGSHVYRHPHFIYTVFLFLGWFPTMQVTPKCWYPSASLTLPHDYNLHCYHHATLKSR
jgi:hypothetical protein